MLEPRITSLTVFGSCRDGPDTHRIIVHNQRTYTTWPNHYFNKEPWCPGILVKVLFQRRALVSLGTASMCISKWVYETPANVRGRLPIYFNEEHRCPFWTASVCISNTFILCSGTASWSISIGESFRYPSGR